jgi:hypothetical protein
MVSDVLLLFYLDKIGLSLTDEAGQASAYLYSEARLYKGASLALFSQSATTRSTGNISVGVKKVGHCNTRGTVSSLLFPAQISAALSLHFQHLMKTKYFFLGGDFFFFCSYNIQHCFICRPSDSTVPTDAGIEPRTVATLFIGSQTL